MKTQIEIKSIEYQLEKILTKAEKIAQSLNRDWGNFEEEKYLEVKRLSDKAKKLMQQRELAKKAQEATSYFSEN